MSTPDLTFDQKCLCFFPSVLAWDPNEWSARNIVRDFKEVSISTSRKGVNQDDVNFSKAGSLGKFKNNSFFW